MGYLIRVDVGRTQNTNLIHSFAPSVNYAGLPSTVAFIFVKW